mgnify:CR=1 FL=1
MDHTQVPFTGPPEEIRAASGITVLEPILFGAIVTALAGAGIPPGAVWVQLCAVISLLTQGLADICWPNGQRVPIGANGLLVAPSSFGKSLIYKLLMAAVEKVIAEAPDDDAFLSSGLLVEDITPAALIAHVALHRFAGICAQDAGTLAPLHDAASALAQILDGSTLRKTRFNTGHVRVVDPRLTVLALLQRSEYDKAKMFSARSGGVGLRNRFLMAVTTDTTRPLHGVVLPAHLNYAHAQRTRELLRATSVNAKIKPKSLPALELSKDARAFLVYVDEELRGHSRDHLSPLAAHVEYVSRHAERVLKLAGSLHLYNRGIPALTEPVSLDTLRTADDIDRRSIQAVQQLAYTPPSPTQEEQDAAQLLDGLHRFYAAYGNPYFELAKLRRYAAGFGLTPTRVTKALPLVIRWGAAQIVTSGKTDLLQLWVPTLPWQAPVIRW